MEKNQEQLKKFWKPDGLTPDPDNEAALKAWMGANGFSKQSGAITALVHSSVHRSARAVAVKALPRIMMAKRKTEAR
jgi:hypothetical protein